MQSGIILSVALAAILAVPGPFVPAAQAQTSFSKGATANPQNEAEWHAALGRELNRNLRSANTSLAVFGGGDNVAAAIAVTVARNGQVTSVRMAQSTGRPNLDQALLRAVSRTTQVAPFTPDMRAGSISFVMQIGTTRG